MSLRHHPAFTPLANQPRLVEIDERLRASVNAERQQSNLPPISREAWISNPKMLLTQN
jgi:hypothetical protein